MKSHKFGSQFERKSKTWLFTCVCYFLTNFCFSPIDSPIKAIKDVFYSIRLSSFCSLDIQVLVSLSSPLFVPIIHFFAGWSKINLEVYDVINCLNKNLLAYFVWYLQNEKRGDIETLFIDRLLNKEPLSDSNVIRTHNHLVRKRALNHLAKLVKWILTRNILMAKYFRTYGPKGSPTPLFYFGK